MRILKYGKEYPHPRLFFLFLPLFLIFLPLPWHFSSIPFPCLSSSISVPLSFHLSAHLFLFTYPLSLSLIFYPCHLLYFLPQRHEFCWICMQDWTLHSNVTGGYFQCNRFDANAGRAEGDGQPDEDGQVAG